MSHNITNQDLPMGLSMALAQNLRAMQYFSCLPESQRQRIIAHACSISSKQEMESYVGKLLQ